MSTPPPPAPDTLRSEASGTARAALVQEPGSTCSGAAKSEALLESLSTSLVPELRRYVAVHRQEIERLVKEGDLSTGLTAGQRYSKIVDGLLSSLLYTTRAVMFPGGDGPRVALV
ncbi:MAG TPA: hypothetical protein VNN80_28755, partial [Polyangiaceae bacterium]|nr:hypothetical protein [Polyangiaceae bacterium]